MLTLLLLLLLALFSMHIFGPIFVRAKTKVATNPSFEVLSDEQAEGSDPQTFLSMVYQLEVLGFSLVGHLSSAPSNVPTTHVILTLFVNRQTQMSAVIMQAASLLPQTAHMRWICLEFLSEFKDGSEVSTINSPMVQVFYDVPHKHVYRVPHLKDVASIYPIHTHLVKQATSPAILPEPGRELDHLRESIKESLAQQVELGYYFLDKSGQHYRHTWRGAFRTTWRVLWPLKQILERRQEREGRRIATAALTG
jgi:hypothetical protein